MKSHWITLGYALRLRPQGPLAGQIKQQILAPMGNLTGRASVKADLTYIFSPEQTRRRRVSLTDTNALAKLPRHTCSLDVVI